MNFHKRIYYDLFMSLSTYFPLSILVMNTIFIENELFTIFHGWVRIFIE